MKKIVQDFWKDESGMGTVEIILIIVVLIGLVIVFKKQINDLVNRIAFGNRDGDLLFDIGDISECIIDIAVIHGLIYIRVLTG